VFVAKLKEKEKEITKKNQEGAYSTHVTLMAFHNWLRRARAPTNCPAPPHTSRQSPRRRFEISPDLVADLSELTAH